MSDRDALEAVAQMLLQDWYPSLDLTVWVHNITLRKQPMATFEAETIKRLRAAS